MVATDDVVDVVQYREDRYTGRCIQQLERVAKQMVHA
jgi:hypothetical protein